MAYKEALRPDGIEVVAIMTPPSSHQIIAEKFIDKNIHIISDKPFTGDLSQAKKLFKKIKSNKNIKYALTHNYSAYPMVREAKVLVEKGKIGKVEYVNVEYVQDWTDGKTVNKNNAKIKVIITSEEFEDKPLQAKLWSENYDFEKVNVVKRIIDLFFNKNIPVIEDKHAIYWNYMDLDSCLLSALDPRINIEDGGVLWIEKTKAATLIDIDTKNILINNEDEMLKFCKNAFLRCMDEIKLRNIGGMILIDFPRMSLIRKKNLHEFIIKEGTKNNSDSNFLGFSRLQLYEMYVPRNFKSLQSFYKNKIEFDFQNHIRSLWRASKKIKSRNNIEFLCGKNLYKRLKLKKIPEFINIVERIDLPNDYGELLEKKI